MKVTIIVAVDHNWVIGDADCNSIPWKNSADMKHFRETTKGHTVVMGRKTFESLGCKPLPGRKNIIITRSKDVTSLIPVKMSSGAVSEIDLHIGSLEDSFVSFQGSDEVFIIGGAEIYKQFICIADRALVSRLNVRTDTANPVIFPTNELDQYMTLSKANWICGKTADENFMLLEYIRNSYY